MIHYPSFWLRPADGDDSYLQSIVDLLARKYNSPSFLPHLTLYATIPIELSKAKEVLHEIVRGIPPFEIKMTQLNYTDHFFKTVFIEFEMNNYLQTLNNRLSLHFGKQFPYEFKPHISLIYKETSTDVKREIIKSLDLKKTYRMDKVTIQDSGTDINDVYDIEGWKIVDEVKLSD